jgi:hypothetical protein
LPFMCCTVFRRNSEKAFGHQSPTWKWCRSG